MCEDSWSWVGEAPILGQLLFVRRSVNARGLRKRIVVVDDDDVDNDDVVDEILGAADKRRRREGLVP